MKIRKLEEIEQDERAFRVKLEKAQDQLRKVKGYKTNVLELQEAFLYHLRISDSYLTDGLELEESNDFIQKVNQEGYLLEESYNERLDKISRDISQYEQKLDALYGERQLLNQADDERKGGENGQS